MGSVTHSTAGNVPQANPSAAWAQKKRIIVCALIVIAAIAVTAYVQNEAIKKMVAEVGAAALLLSPADAEIKALHGDLNKAVGRIVGAKAVNGVLGQPDEKSEVCFPQPPPKLKID